MIKNKSILNKKTILVTGGAGYIGAHFVNKLKERKNTKIIVVDDFRISKKNIIKNKDIIYYSFDIADTKKLENLFEKYDIDVVIHFAATANVADSVKNPQNYYINNVSAGIILLRCMIKNNVKKIIFSSSASVYGETNDDAIIESCPKSPINPYGHTKFIFEQILRDYHLAYLLDSISFRYFCAAGCDESLEIGEYHNPETHVIPLIFDTLFKKRKEFYIYGNDYPTLDGTGVRDYIHVNDLASAHLLAMDFLLENNNVCDAYNLGINKGYSVMELIKIAEKISGRKLNYKIKNRRDKDPSRLVADSSKVQKELKWKPKYTNIEKIMFTVYNFYRYNKL